MKHRHPFSASRRRALVAFGAATVTGRSFAQREDAYPQRQVVVKVGVPAGGPADSAIRSAQPLLQASLGKPVVIDNMPGAGGAIAVSSVMNGAPDGHLLYCGPGADFLLAPQLALQARYQPLAFPLVAVLGVSDFVLITSKEHDFRSAAELVAYANTRSSRTLSMAHWGAGSAPHLAGSEFQELTGTHFLQVPYRGAAPVLSDLLGGQVDTAFAPLTAAVLGMVKSGRINAVGVAGDSRNAALPDLPALRETRGLEKFDHTVWSAIWAPPRTPDAVVTRLSAIFNEWIIGSDNLARIAANASRTVGAKTSAQNAAFVRSEYEKYSRGARLLKLQPQ